MTTSKKYSNTLPEITLKYKAGTVEKQVITCSNDTVSILRKCFDADTLEVNESMLVLFLNKANKTIGWIKHSSGGACSTVVDIKLILVTALQCGAQSLIISHNHPSGNCKPSESDRGITKKLHNACKVLELTLLDHIIITESGSYSFADEGELNY